MPLCKKTPRTDGMPTKTIKRLCALLLTVLFLFSAAACKKTERETRNTSAQSAASSGISGKQESAESPLLWRATDPDGKVIWLFGTIHIGDKRNKQIVKRLEPILKQCDALAVEFDIVAYSKNLSAQTRDLTMFVYDDGTTVRDHIPEQLYDDLKSFLTEEKLYNALYDHYKPGLWFQLVSQALIKKTDLSTNKAMDTLLIKDARSAEREIWEVESSDFQYSVLAQIPDEYYILALQQSIKTASVSAKQLEMLYQAWLEGDEELITEMAEASEIRELTPEKQRLADDYYDKMVVRRNIGMAEKAKEYLQSEKTVFFAVGAMHFLGENGIISLLEKEGFTVEKVTI